ncbi:SMC-Scp complex subunit ScpB [Methanotorris formicicus]|uniref:Chromosome segregation and condensation protein, ScpB n=1 Tax=Methanotorris formicicus Mc-S-70 TaxID=647171 RepID=H1KXN4_9EURY|nr:SMC-Scp complex subunit ScpB [Methanotorris formicicus]EHP88107.1 chromosome segregation and condensation protein, ScpB [Methanotorris formicicus Mc-S-70]
MEGKISNIINDDIINTVEAFLFANGNPVDIEDIAKKFNLHQYEVHEALKALKERYKNTSINIRIFNNKCVMELKEEYAENIIPYLDTGIDEEILKTLAWIAYLEPVKQSEIVKIRGSKAYKHIKDLEKIGYIKSKKEGNSKILHLTKKFDELGISKEEIKKMFNK